MASITMTVSYATSPAAMSGEDGEGGRHPLPTLVLNTRTAGSSEAPLVSASATAARAPLKT